MNSILEKKQDIRLSMVFVWVVFGIFLTNASSVLSEVLNISSQTVSTISKGIILSFLILNVFTFIIRIEQKALIFYACLLVLFSLNYVFNDIRSGFLELLPQFLTLVLPVIILTFSLNNYRSLIDCLVKFSPIIIVLSFLLVLIKGETKTNEYYMGFANSLVLPIFATIYAFFKRNTKWMLVFTAMGLFSVLTLGSRGALLAISLYYVVMLIKNFLVSKKPIFTVIVLAITILGIAYFDAIMNWLNDFLFSIGFYSRTLNSFLSDEISLSGRDHIYTTLLNAVWENPLAITGIGGEYTIIDGYAHNLFLELIYQFGFIFGGILTVIIVIYSIKTLFNYKENSHYYDVLLLSFCASVPILLVSNTIWRAPYFWMWIVLCLKGEPPKTEDEENELTIL